MLFVGITRIKHYLLCSGRKDSIRLIARLRVGVCMVNTTCSLGWLRQLINAQIMIRKWKTCMLENRSGVTPVTGLSFNGRHYVSTSWLEDAPNYLNHGVALDICS